jgi:hypothetical protein
MMRWSRETDALAFVVVAAVSATIAALCAGIARGIEKPAPCT